MLNDFMVVRRRDQLGSIYFGGRYWLLVVALSGRLCDVSYRLVETCAQGHHDDIYFQYEFRFVLPPSCISCSIFAQVF